MTLVWRWVYEKTTEMTVCAPALSREVPVSTADRVKPSERISLVFKKLRVVRMVDRKRNALVYLTYSDWLVDGYPQNSVTAVAVDRSTPIPVGK